MTKQFNIKSSSSKETYIVTFKLQDNLISVNCNCKAGQMKTLCKHRLNIIDGNFSSLEELNQSSELEETLNSIGLENFSNLFKELNQVEEELKTLTQQRKKIKKVAGINLSNALL